MMFGILLLLPSLFQIIFGRKAIGEDIKLKFIRVCVISFLGQILLSILYFISILHSLEENKVHCGMPLVGVIFLSFILLLY